MKTELLTELQNILQEISTKEAVIFEVKRFEKESVFNNLFDSESEIKKHEKELRILKRKYNQLTLKLTELNY